MLPARSRKNAVFPFFFSLSSGAVEATSAEWVAQSLLAGRSSSLDYSAEQVLNNGMIVLRALYVYAQMGFYAKVRPNLPLCILTATPKTT